ncbi:MAG: 2-C-methyl-D-erythritol 4-phosphate cytidylyltransferase [Firmicutes bacterium]|nr:2-C-methyl-D-erythritol 4-phosphate cytidylyltransferase [Bacillota bacterium]
MKNGAIIVAGGKGKRMGSSVAKQYLELCGKMILAYTIECFEKTECIDEIVIVTGKEEIDFCREEICDKYGYKKVKCITAGGKERQDSVYNGLKCLGKDTDIVLIHDGVRPFVKSEDIERTVRSVQEWECCVLGVKVKDTIKVCDGDGITINTPERSGLWIAQTPQAFKYDIIMRAYESAFGEGFYGTDDAMIVERFGKKIKMVEGSYENIKITTPEDIYIGEAIIKQRQAVM